MSSTVMAATEYLSTILNEKVKNDFPDIVTVCAEEEPVNEVASLDNITGELVCVRRSKTDRIALKESNMVQIKKKSKNRKKNKLAAKARRKNKNG